ncbi:MAG: hypothetical protein ACRDC6_05000 [Shewanella sp.]
MNSKISVADMIGILVKYLDKWPTINQMLNVDFRTPIGWEWRITTDGSFITNGDSIITKDVWLMAKAKKEMELNGPRIIPAKEITTSKYTKQIRGVSIDVYDVLKAWGVTNPALQHLIKKALQCGERGHKDEQQDLQDIIDSAVRAKELEQ